MHTPKGPILNALTRLTLATATLTTAAAPELACTAKTQIIRTETAEAVREASKEDEKLAEYGKKVRSMHEKLAEVAITQGGWHEAAEHFEAAGNMQKAKQAYETYIENLKRENVYYIIGHIYKDLKLTAQARAMYQKGIEHYEAKGQLFMAGMGYGFLGDPRKAIEYTLKSGERSDLDLAFLAQWYEAAKLPDDATRTYLELAESCEKGQALKMFAIVYYRKAKQPQKAQGIVSEMQSEFFTDDNSNQEMQALRESAMAEKMVEVGEKIGDTELLKSYGPEVASEMEEGGSYLRAAEIFEKAEYWQAAKRCYEKHLSPPPEDALFRSRYDINEDTPEDAFDIANIPDDEVTPTAAQNNKLDFDESDLKSYEGLIRVLQHLRKK